MVRKTYAQLQQELEALKAEESRQVLAKEVKALRSKVRPSKIRKVGRGIVAGIKVFDNALKKFEEKADL